MNPPSKQCVKREEGGVEIGEWTNRDKFCTRKFFGFFPSMFFLRRSRKKNKYRWFKVEGFVVGVVGRWWWWSSLSCPVSQRESCVTLRKTFRNHVNEAGEGSSVAKLFALEISRSNMCNCARLLNTAAQLCRRNSDRNEAKTVVKLQTAV